MRSTRSLPRRGSSRGGAFRVLGYGSFDCQVPCDVRLEYADEDDEDLAEEQCRRTMKEAKTWKETRIGRDDEDPTYGVDGTQRDDVH